MEDNQNDESTENQAKEEYFIEELAIEQIREM